MPAIVLDHKQPKQESSGWQHKDEAEPETVHDSDASSCPKRRKRYNRHHQLKQAAAKSRLPVLYKNLQPSFSGVEMRRNCPAALGVHLIRAFFGRSSELIASRLPFEFSEINPGLACGIIGNDVVHSR